MIHLDSICCIISVTWPGCGAYWQALCSKETARAIHCPETGPARPVVPKPGLRTHYVESPEHLLKRQILGLHPGCTEPDSWGEGSLECVFKQTS